MSSPNNSADPYDDLPYDVPPDDTDICPICGTEFLLREARSAWPYCSTQCSVVSDVENEQDGVA